MLSLSSNTKFVPSSALSIAEIKYTISASSCKRTLSPTFSSSTATPQAYVTEPVSKFVSISISSTINVVTPASGGTNRLAATTIATIITVLTINFKNFAIVHSPRSLMYPIKFYYILFFSILQPILQILITFINFHFLVEHQNLLYYNRKLWRIKL